MKVMGSHGIVTNFQGHPSTHTSKELTSEKSKPRWPVAVMASSTSYLRSTNQGMIQSRADSNVDPFERLKVHPRNN